MEAQNFALVQRPSIFSWEAMTILRATVQDAPPIRVEFPRGTIILSVYPNVAWQAGSSSLKFPTLDDILVRIDSQQGTERRLTSRFDATMLNGAGSLPNVTLGAYRDTTGGARVMNYELPFAAPDLQVTFSWKHNISAAGGPFFQDIFASVVFNCNLIDKPNYPGV